MNWCIMSLGWMSIRHPIEQGGHRMFLGESSHFVEIQLHGVWLAHVRGADVAYWACKKCKRKVDQETGCCKKQSTHGCATEQEDSRTILATVHLADWTGQLVDNLLVNEAALCELTGFKTAELLLTEVDRQWHRGVVLQASLRCPCRDEPQAQAVVRQRGFPVYGFHATVTQCFAGIARRSEDASRMSV